MSLRRSEGVDEKEKRREDCTSVTEIREESLENQKSIKQNTAKIIPS